MLQRTRGRDAQFPERLYGDELDNYLREQDSARRKCLIPLTRTTGTYRLSAIIE